MQLNPYVTFNGNCEEAFKFYEQTLGGKIEMMLNHETAPPEMRTLPGWDKKIMHVQMTVNGTVLMGSDSPPQMYQKPQGFSVSLVVATPEEAEKAWAALSKDGAIRMPLAETFFAKRFGMVTDRFGVPWMINCTP